MWDISSKLTNFCFTSLFSQTVGFKIAAMLLAPFLQINCPGFLPDCVSSFISKVKSVFFTPGALIKYLPLSLTGRPRAYFLVGMILIGVKRPLAYFAYFYNIFSNFFHFHPPLDLYHINTLIFNFFWFLGGHNTYLDISQKIRLIFSNLL